MSQQLDPISDLMNAGSDIMKSVDQALSSGDFSHLSSDIGRSVRKVTNGPDIPQNQQRQPGQGQASQGTNGQFTQGADTDNGNRYAGQGMSNGSTTQGNTSGTTRNYTRSTYRRTTTTGNATQQRWQQTTQRTTTNTRSYGATRRTTTTPFLVRKPNRSSGNGKFIVGTIFAVINGIGALGALEDIAYMPEDFIILAVITAGFWFLAHMGRKEKQLVDRFYQYANIIGIHEYYSIAQLASQTGRSEDAVVKDLKDMMAKGWLPQARMDAQHTTLMLTQNIYNQYLNVQKDQMNREREENIRKAQEAQMTPAQRQYRKILEDGQRYIDDIHKANDAIPDEVMSDKLYRLEDIMRRIFETAKDHPESASDLRRLMDYYLPTTNKLLKAYIDLDQQPYGGENIDNTKKQIEDAMDTINDAFEQLLDSMYTNMAWDVSSDISVMKTMLKQDGLTGDGLTGEKQKDNGTTASSKGSDAAGASSFQPQFGDTYSDPDFSKEAEEVLGSEQSGGSAKTYEPHLTFGSDTDTKKS